MVVYAIADQRRFGQGPIIAQGEPVTAGQKLLRIPDLRRMKVDTRVHEAQISQVRPGQVVRVQVDALPNHELPGRIETISPTASPADFRNRDVKVYPVSIALPEVGLPLK